MPNDKISKIALPNGAVYDIEDENVGITSSQRKTNSALYRYMLCATKLDKSLVPMNSVNNSVATNKTLTTDSFDPFGDFFYWNSTSTYNADANVGDGYWYRQILCDLRYSFNCGGYDAAGTLTAKLPLYLVVTPQDDNSVILYSSPLVQALPSSDDGLLYIYLGQVYPDTYPYRLILSSKHPIYWYKDGQVKQYISNRIDQKTFKTNNSPYLLRQTNNGELDQNTYFSKVNNIVGGTVAWNQLVKTLSNDNFITETGATVTYTDGVAEVSSTTASNGLVSRYYTDVIKDHKYLLSFDIYATEVYSSVTLGFRSATGAYIQRNTVANTWTSYATIRNAVQGLSNSRVYLYKAGDVYENIKFRNAMAIDLTAMFGSTIADYLYGLESGTPGAGIAKLKSWGFCTKPYYAYDAGSLQSVNTSAHKTVGFNQWDEESESGYYDVGNNGAKADSANWARCKNPIPCVPNTTYYFYSNYSGSDSFGALIYYDDGGNQIGYKSTSVKNNTFTTPANCHYLSFYAKPSWFSSHICINLSKTSGTPKNGDYVAYAANTYALDSSLTLRGIPKLDASNNLYYDGDSYEVDGTVTRKYGIVDLGTLNWASSIPGQFLYEDASFDGASDPNGASMKCSSVLMGGNAYDGGSDNVICARVGTYKRLWVKCSAYSTADSFTTAMSGVCLVYKLATPTTETATAYAATQSIDPDGTEEYVDYEKSQGTRDVAIPVGHNTSYATNTEATIDYMNEFINNSSTKVPTQASINSSGLIIYKNSSGTSLFTLQLPLYNGGAS